MTVDELYEKYWKAAKWEMPEFRCESGRHRKAATSGALRRLAAAAVVVPLLFATLATLVGCKPSGAAEHHQPPAPVTTGPTPTPPPSPLVVSVKDDGLAPVVAELLDVNGGGAR